MKKDKPIKTAEMADVNKATMTDKDRAMRIFHKAIDMAKEMQKNAPTFQSADEPSLKDNQRKANKFPIEVLHPRLRNIIREANTTLGFPADHLAGSMLAAMAAAIGNTHAVEHMEGWKEYCILFTALVGSPGSNKSHPLSFAMQPLIDHDAEQAALHAEALKRYNAAMELPPKERVANGYEQSPTEPIRKRFTMQDVTPEAVHRILSENPRCLCLVSDELAGWFKNFNRYNSTTVRGSIL